MSMTTQAQQPAMGEELIVPEDNDKIAACLERVADDHSGCFSEEDAFAVECAIKALTRTPSANPESVGDDVVSRLNRYAEPGNLAAVHPAVQQTCRDAAATIATLQAEKERLTGADGRTHLYFGGKTRCGAWLNPDLKTTVCIPDCNCPPCRAALSNQAPLTASTESEA